MGQARGDQIVGASLPQTLIEHLDAVLPQTRDSWLRALTERLPILTQRWGLVLGEALPGGWNSSVLACTRDDRRAVLKLTLEPRDVAVEAAALRHWGSGAAVQVLASDPMLGALLLERLEPGSALSVSDGSVLPVADALTRLHAAPSPTAGCPTLADHYLDSPSRLKTMWNQAQTSVPEQRVRAAAEELVKLSSGEGISGHSVLLHGDAVPANFLLGAAGYRAIDPRAKVGDPAFDAAFWSLFANDGQGIADTAAELGRELALDVERVLRWTRAIAVDRCLQIASSPGHAEMFARLSAHSEGLGEK